MKRFTSIFLDYQYLYTMFFQQEAAVPEEYGIPANTLDPSISWKDVYWLQSITRLPIIIKGILTKEDAELAVEHGVQGIIVSNHGGRQLDGGPASVHTKPCVYSQYTLHIICQSDWIEMKVFQTIEATDLKIQSCYLEFAKTPGGRYPLASVHDSWDTLQIMWRMVKYNGLMAGGLVQQCVRPTLDRYSHLFVSTGNSRVHWLPLFFNFISWKVE